jgi:hypothetical protein
MSSFSFTNELTLHFHKSPGSRRALEELVLMSGCKSLRNL